VSNSGAQSQRALQTVVKWVDENWHDMTLVDEEIEIVV